MLDFVEQLNHLRHMNTISNIIGYKFTEITQLKAMQSTLLEKTNALELKGTILLSHEGINIALAGHHEKTKIFEQWLNTQPPLEGIHFKVSSSKELPFSKMMVKIKDEIIRMDVPEVKPHEQTGTHLAPEEFKAWLDENKEILILDTRNAFELEFGRFKDAEHLQLEHFRQFPNKADMIPRNKPIVMYCTGGIRCEKASTYLLQKGYEEVYQLEGGILNYFEKCGGEHYEGDCFVFDDRIAVDSNGREK